METTMKHSIEIDQEPAGTAERNTFQQRWWAVMELRIGVVPLPIFIILFGLVAGFVALGKIPKDITTTLGLLVLGGSLCSEIGKRTPVLKLIGGAAIVSAFLPSYLNYAGLIPQMVSKSITEFTKSTQFIYLFIAAIIVGSIFSMDRSTLVKGFAKIILPVAIGSVAACGVGLAVATACGIPIKEALFFIIVPIMGGGVGEGVIPLSLGYSEILGSSVSQGQMFARLLPVALFANLVSIACAGCLNHFGKKYPKYSGNGRLQAGEHDDSIVERERRHGHDDNHVYVDVTTIAAGGVTAVVLYMVGVMSHALAGIPAPIGMLFTAILCKVFKLIPPSLEEGARSVSRFFTVGVTYPLMFAIAVSSTPWKELIAAFHPAQLITITVTVVTLTAVGFFVARWFSLNPIESAVVNACHSGLGGTGDVAILTAAERMGLMPFAQIATRIGGALTVMLALFLMSKVGLT
jgi:Na+/citrate or Na+/malate symporter